MRRLSHLWLVTAGALAARRAGRTALAWRIRGLTETVWRIQRPVRFLRAELSGSAEVSYALRGGAMVRVRHRTRDVAVLREVLGPKGSYVPPAEVAAFLDGPIRVLDLGGNIGVFGVFALRRWQVVSLVSFEPDPANAEILRTVVAANGAEDRWQVIEQAAASSSGPLAFLPDRFSESRLADGEEDAITVAGRDIFALGEAVELMKIDIEGGEWNLLRDPRLRELDVRVIVLEWHARGAADHDPRRLATTLLRRAGYAVLTSTSSASGFGLIWAYRRP